MFIPRLYFDNDILLCILRLYIVVVIQGNADIYPGFPPLYKD